MELLLLVEGEGGCELLELAVCGKGYGRDLLFGKGLGFDKADMLCCCCCCCCCGLLNESGKRETLPNGGDTAVAGNGGLFNGLGCGGMGGNSL